jgi:hypothetical protein
MFIKIFIFSCLSVYRNVMSTAKANENDTVCYFLGFVKL